MSKRLYPSIGCNPNFGPIFPEKMCSLSADKYGIFLFHRSILSQLYYATEIFLLLLPPAFHHNAPLLCPRVDLPCWSSPLDIQLTLIKWGASEHFTITAEIHMRSLDNFYCQYADRHMNLKFIQCVSKREGAIRQYSKKQIDVSF